MAYPIQRLLGAAVTSTTPTKASEDLRTSHSICLSMRGRMKPVLCTNSERRSDIITIDRSTTPFSDVREFHSVDEDLALERFLRRLTPP